MKTDHYFRELDQQWEIDVERNRVAKKRLEHACKWCGQYTENKSRKCDECLRDIENDRRIDEARGK